jgi:hypothetical protein
MATEHSLRRYRRCYAKLLRLYPMSYCKRFGEGMEQTFNDLCRERIRAKKGLFSFALWMYFETSIGILRENIVIMPSTRIIRVLLMAASLLIVPLTASFLVDGWNWGVGDYVIAWVMFSIAGLGFAFAASMGDTIAYKIAVGLSVAAAFLLTWINLAVEIIGDDNPANLMFFGVPIVGVMGAVIARFEARGMSRALFATALTQALVPVIALMIWNPQVSSWSPGVPHVFGLNAFFVMLFVGSALLFQIAARRQPPAISLAGATPGELRYRAQSGESQRK